MWGGVSRGGGGVRRMEERATHSFSPPSSPPKSDMNTNTDERDLERKVREMQRRAVVEQLYWAGWRFW